MKQPIQLTNTMPSLRTSFRWPALPSGSLYVLVVLAWFGISPMARAVTPLPDGGYPRENTAEGQEALLNLNLETGQDNTAVGFRALRNTTREIGNTAIGAFALESNTKDLNTAIGFEALEFNTIGHDNTASGAGALMFNRGDSSSNTAIGNSSLYFNINASFNTACGFQALGGASRVSNPFSDEPNPNQDADSGFRNTATGAQALFSNLGGNENTADGDGALLFNLNGHDNTATGKSALSGNANGSFNTANGAFALFGGDGSLNTATGFDAMLDNTSGNRNTGDGVFALSANSTGSDNTAIGAEALGSNSTGSFNTAIGSGALLSNTSGNSNIALGASAGTRLTTGSGNIDIGNPGDRLDSYTIRIGRSDIKAGYKGNTSNAYIGGIRGVTIANGVGVIIDTQGHLGTWVSSARFKEAIEPMDNASEAILSLKPVTFRYKHELDPDGIPQFGLVAEQVEKVNHDLVARDDQGRPDTVRYEAVNAMLLNEFLKEHRRVEALEATVAKLQSVVQKVSNQIELTKPGPQVVINQ